MHARLVADIHGEQEIKPTQATIKNLRSLGFTHDMISCRGQEELEVTTIENIGMLCFFSTAKAIPVQDIIYLPHSIAVVGTKNDEVLGQEAENSRPFASCLGTG